MKNIGFVLLILMTCLFIGSTENFLKENSEPIGVVWFGYTAQEVNLLAYDGTGWVSFDSSNSGFPDKDVMGIAVDESGNRWFGTKLGGVLKYSKGEWTSFTTSNSGLPVNSVFSIVPTNEGTWFGTNGGGLSFFDGENWTTFNKNNSPLPFNVIVSFAVDNLNRVWIPLGPFDGVYMYDGQKWTIFNKDNSPLPDNYVTEIDVENENIWIGTRYYGLAKYNGEDWTIYNKNNSCLPGNTIYAMEFDNYGDLWLSVLDKNGTPGEVWFNGLVKFNEETCKLFSSEDYPVESIDHLAVDGANNIWFTRYDGISMYDGSQWHDFNADNSPHPSGYAMRMVTAEPNHICGDADNSGEINFDDVTLLVNYMFNGGEIILPRWSINVNGANRIDISDLVTLVKKVCGEPVELACTKPLQ